MCQLLYQVDREQSELLLQLYKANPDKFEYIRFFTANNEASGSLDGLMCSCSRCQYKVVHCHPGKGNSLTDYILIQRLSGYFVVLLEDHMGGHHHTVGLDIASKLLFDPMEKSVLKLNSESLDIACGQNRKFVKFKIAAELRHFRYNEKKKNKRKYKTTGLDSI